MRIYRTQYLLGCVDEIKTNIKTTNTIQSPCERNHLVDNVMMMTMMEAK